MWYMLMASENEQIAAEQKLAKAAQAQLEAIQEIFGAEVRAIAASPAAGDAPRAKFAAIARAGAADAVLVLDAGREVDYPSENFVATAASPEPPALVEASRLEAAEPERALDLAESVFRSDATVHGAKALKIVLRLCDRLGQVDRGLAIMHSVALRLDIYSSVDGDGRMPVPATLLWYALRWEDRSGGKFIEELKQTAADYTLPMRAGQRRYLLAELKRTKHAGEELERLLAAEELALAVAESGQRTFVAGQLSPSRVEQIWSFDNGRGDILLFRQATLSAMLDGASEKMPGLLGKTCFQFPDGGPQPPKPLRNAIATRPLDRLMPGVNIVMQAAPEMVDLRTSARITFYLSIGFVVLVLTGFMTAGAMSTIHRRLALARIRTDLAATVSHELRTPIASTRVLLDTLLDGGLDDPTLTRDYIQLMARENARLGSLVEKFLIFSRIEARRMDLRTRRVSAAQIVQEASNAMSERFAAAGTTLNIQVAKDLPPLDVHPEAIVTVLTNLLENALRYTGEEKAIALWVEHSDAEVVFTVEDNGIGIAAGEKQKIFGAFYQSDSRLSRRGEGVGLGLSIVKALVDGHGGRVQVDSTVGRGSKFIVILPAGAKPW